MLWKKVQYEQLAIRHSLGSRIVIYIYIYIKRISIESELKRA